MTLASGAVGSRWSSEFTISQHQDFYADTFALDYDGKVILLAGKRHIGIRRVSGDGTEQLEKFPRNQKYDTTVAEWNPNTGSRQYCALTTNERVDYLLIREGGVEELTPLKHHTRQVSGVSWSHSHPCKLVSGSLDSTTLVWDTRDTRKPVVTFLAVAGVDHVRWNKLSNYFIATAHDGDIRIWDERKGTLPVQYIAGHTNKIHDADWSETHEYQISTCSQDCTIKLFDMTNPRRPESVMHGNAPVWRARHTPWGEGLVTALAPGITGESSLLLWNLSNLSGPAHTFVGPIDVVVELQWRKEGNDYQLITWSKDQSLRIWRIEPFLQRLCGYLDSDARADTHSEIGLSTGEIEETELAGMAAMETFNLSLGDSTGAQLMERNISVGARSLEEEFERLAIDNPLTTITFKSIDVVNRCCVVHASVNSYELSLLVSFPPSYPYNAAPSFQIGDSSLIDPLLKTKLLKVLKQTAQQRVRRNRTCLDSCLQQLVTTLELTVQLTEPSARVPLGSSPARVADAASVYSSFHDAYIPYPKTCGARFCSVGTLVYFSRPARLNSRPEPATPRSLSAASFGNSYVGSYPRYGTTAGSQDQVDSDLGFYLADRSINRGLVRGSRATKMARSVSVSDVSKLFLIHKELADKYILDLKNVAKTCAENALVAASIGRTDLVQVWKLAGLAVEDVIDDDMPWRAHPFSSATMDYLIEHYAKISDIQTAAMLSCIFPEQTADKPDYMKSLSSGNSRYHTIHPADTSLDGWCYPVLKHHRSNSWSESAEEISFNIVEHREALPEVFNPRRSRNWSPREELKKCYADILHMWGNLEGRTRVLKLLNEPVTPHDGLEFTVECQKCKKSVVGAAHCSSCRQLALRCVICRVVVKGASNVCLVCGHGGHVSHMISWFSSESVCPSGCGCNCTAQTSHAFEA